MGSPASSWAGAEPGEQQAQDMALPRGGQLQGAAAEDQPAGLHFLGRQGWQGARGVSSAAVQLPLESRHTHSPSPVSVKGWAVCSSRTDASAAGGLPNDKSLSDTL